MALTVTARGGNASNAASSTTVTLNPGSNFAAGAAVICISADNSSTGGSTNNITSVTDTLGNEWVERQQDIFDNGAASAGVQSSIFVSDQRAGLLTTGTTITITFGNNTTAKSWALWEVSASNGYVPTYVTSGSAAGQSGSSAPSVTTSSITVGDAIIGMVAMEAGTTQSSTADADATNGTWSAQQYFEVGSTTTGNCIASQSKVQTTTDSTQTYNPTLGLTCDCQASWIQFSEIRPSKTAVSRNPQEASGSMIAGVAAMFAAAALLIPEPIVLNDPPPHTIVVQEQAHDAHAAAYVWPGNALIENAATFGGTELVVGTHRSTEAAFNSLTAWVRGTPPQLVPAVVGAAEYTVGANQIGDLLPSRVWGTAPLYAAPVAEIYGKTAVVPEQQLDQYAAATVWPGNALIENAAILGGVDLSIGQQTYQEPFAVVFGTPSELLYEIGALEYSVGNNQPSDPIAAQVWGTSPVLYPSETVPPHFITAAPLDGEQRRYTARTWGLAVATEAGDGSIAGTSTLVFTPTAAIVGDGAVAGTSALVFTTTAAITGDAAIAATSAMVFTTTAAIIGSAAITGTSDLVFTNTGAMTGDAAISATAAMVFTNSAALSSENLIAGTSDMVFADTGSLTGDAAITGTSDMVFTNTAAITGAIPAAGTSAMVFSTTGAVTGAGAIAGLSDPVFSLTGAVTGDAAISGTSSPTFSLTGTVTGDAAIAGTSALVFTNTGSLLGEGAIAGLSDPVFTVEGDITGLEPDALEGTVAMVFTVSGTLTGDAAIAGTSAAVFTNTGSLLGAGAIAGSAAPTFSCEGTVTGAAAISCTSALLFTNSGAITGAGAIAGLSDPVFSVTGDLIEVGDGAIAGEASFAFTLTGNIQGFYPIEGSTSLAFTTAGDVLGAGQLTGESPLAFTTTGAVLGAGELAALATMVFDLDGSLIQPDGLAFPHKIVVVQGPDRFYIVQGTSRTSRTKDV